MTNRNLVVLRFSTILFLLVFSAFICNAYTEFEEHTISSTFIGAVEVYATDMDIDGDIDVRGAALTGDKISWWENNGVEEFTEHVIESGYDAADAIIALDLDGDDDIDVFSSRRGCGITSSTWWENDGEMDFTGHILDPLHGAHGIYATDLDGDGDNDLLEAASCDNNFSWWENDGDGDFTEYYIALNFNGGEAIYAADVDGDDDVDVLGAGWPISQFVYYENDGNQDWTSHILSDNLIYPESIFAVDVDGDGDMDILGAADRSNTVLWWENEGDQDFDQHNIATNFSGAQSVYAADLDNDGDMDVLGAAAGDNEIAWWENDGDEDFTERTIGSNFNSAQSVFAIDLDSDDDIDVLGAAQSSNKITWWENRFIDAPGLFSLSRPGNGATLNESEFTFRWETAENLDPNDVITYTIYFSTDEGFSDPITIDADTDTFVAVDILEDDMQYWWKVHAQDFDTDGTWSYEVNTFNTYYPEPPENFNIINPVNGSQVNTMFYTFEWEPTTDPDPGDEFVFRLFLSTDEDFTDPRRVFAGTETSVEVTRLEEDSQYWWKVLAEDSNTEGRFSDETRTFIVNMVWKPYNLGAELEEETGEVSLTWEHDPVGGDDLDELVNFIVYRDDNEIERSVEPAYTDNLNSPGGHTYIYQVSAQFQQGESEMSNHVGVQWLPDAVSNSSDSEIPNEYSISSIHPNPFNMVTSIAVGLPEPSRLNVSIFNIFGQQVAELASGKYQPGYQQFTFDASELSTGIYFIHARVPGKMNEVRKVVLMK
ncbi:MAG: FG-GAP-like repeat-containing protein [Candidatus Electryonea clarkiae]|nr:FG-GAP-like repeat-containing protein [Candidatus Electryonea clarkiae]MDP8288596.1 FG-GAP-like repeat-containing protein [Candidatus Electryonea clarkiae]